jgi:flagellar protein FlaJ
MPYLISPGDIEKLKARIKGVREEERIIGAISEVFYELKRYEAFTASIRRELSSALSDYQGRRCDYFRYKERINSILKGKTREDALSENSEYVKVLAAKMKKLNEQFFYAVYNDFSYEEIERISALAVKEREAESELRAERERQAKEEKNTRERQEILGKAEMSKRLKGDAPQSYSQENAQAQAAGNKSKGSSLRKNLIKAGMILASPFVFISEAARSLFATNKKGDGKEKEQDKAPGKQPGIKVKQVKPVNFMEEAAKDSKTENIDSRDKPIFEGMGKNTFFQTLKKEMREEHGFISDKEEMPLSIESLPEIDMKEIENTYMMKEAQRIKSIIEKERIYSSYSTSTIASMANISVKTISSWLLNKFPKFFKTFYNTLRAADVKILSNTYLNMMVLFTVASLGLFSIIFIPIFLILNNFFLLAIGKALLVGIGAAAASFFIFYIYPNGEVKKRRRSIKANLPFAINHMTAIAGAGTPPVMMFKLIGESNEYGEISHEFSKIVDYIEVFGFDPMTSIKSVSSTTPSKELKELLTSLVSSIESGAEIKTFLRAKANEAMANYRLDLQKYNETLTIYSDVYMGILIAAPLFFVITLALVSILGTSIKGMNVNSIMIIGTYLVVPALNVLFIMFLQLTEPEV